MKKKQLVRPNSTQKNEGQNNKIFIPKVSSMVISEKIMQNLLRIPSGQSPQKIQPHQNLSSFKLSSPLKTCKQSNQAPTVVHNYLVSNTSRLSERKEKPYLSKSFTKVPSKCGLQISQIIAKAVNTSQIVRYDQNTLPLHKLITKFKNNFKEKRSISQLPTMSTDRVILDCDQIKTKRKKSVRFHEKVECLVIGLQEGEEEYKYKFFEPLVKQ